LSFFLEAKGDALVAVVPEVEGETLAKVEIALASEEEGDIAFLYVSFLVYGTIEVEWLFCVLQGRRAVLDGCGEMKIGGCR